MSTPEFTPAEVAPQPTAQDRLRALLAEFGGLHFDIEQMIARRDEVRRMINELSTQFPGKVG